MIGSVMAPVLIVTYDRLEHLKKTITSLQTNLYAEQTDLFIASDFQRSNTESKAVSLVRDYLQKVNGFRSVTIFTRKSNLGVVENCDLAVQSIFKLFNKIIIMNDDLITAHGFLKFINEALEKYGQNREIFSITGYCPPISIPQSYQFDVFFLGRMNAWGCGITQDNYYRVCDITRKEFDKLTANKELSHKFIKTGGRDMLQMLKQVAYGSLEAWDVRCMYTQFINSQCTVYPTQSLVQNIGFDGTGMHCGISDRFDVRLSDKTIFLLPDKPIIDSRIVKANRIFRDGSLIEHLRARIINIIPKTIKQRVPIPIKQLFQVK